MPRLARLLLCLVAALPLALGRVPAATAQPSDDAAKVEAAKKEGKIVWYVSMFDIDTAEKVGQAFETKYPGVQVQVVRATAGVIYQRVLQEAKPVFRRRRVLLDRGRPLPEFQGAKPDPAVCSCRRRPGGRRASSISTGQRVSGCLGRSDASGPQHAAGIRRRQPKHGTICWIRNGRTRSRSDIPRFRATLRPGCYRSPTLWLGLFRKIGQAEPADRPVRERRDHPAQFRRAARCRRPDATTLKARTAVTRRYHLSGGWGGVHDRRPRRSWQKRRIRTPPSYSWISLCR